MIQEESATELIKLNSNYPNERFREKLLDAAASHDLGDITTVAVFDNEQESMFYLKKENQNKI